MPQGEPTHRVIVESMVDAWRRETRAVDWEEVHLAVHQCIPKDARGRMLGAIDRGEIVIVDVASGRLLHKNSRICPSEYPQGMHIQLRPSTPADAEEMERLKIS